MESTYAKTITIDGIEITKHRGGRTTNVIRNKKKDIPRKSKHKKGWD